MADYSPSKLTAYGDCPLKYRFSAIDGIKKPASIYQFVGTVVHSTLREVVDVRQKFGRELGFEDAVKIFDRIWKEEWTDRIVMDREYLRPDDYRELGHGFLKKFFEIESGRERWEVVAFEKGCGFDIPGTGRTMGGFIDRLERRGGSFRIIDYKCTDRAKSQRQADEDQQLGIYELAVREIYPEAEEVTLEWYILGAGEVSTSRRTEEQREELMREVVRTVRAIETDTEYLPLGTRWCPCEYVEECESEKELRRKKAEVAGRDLAEIVDEYAGLCDQEAALKARQKELEAKKEMLRPRLEEFCRETGAWSVEGLERLLEVKRRVDHGIPPRGSEPRLRLEEMVRDAGLWEELSQLDKAAVLRAIESGRFGDSGDEALCLFEEKEKYSFKPRPRAG